jgi:uncharacterized protein (DUF1697 family)
VVERDPFGAVADQPKLYQVSFLSDRLAPEVERELAAADVAPERVAVHGREIYAWHPGGVQRSPLAKLLTDKKLGVAATARNWNTVTKLLELARATLPLRRARPRRRATTAGSGPSRAPA